MSLAPPPDSTVSAVLDTNVVLDWLIFRNPQVVTIGRAIEEGRLTWIVTPACRDELAHVLGRGLFADWAPDEAGLWKRWERFSITASSQEPTLQPRLRCTDPDDQKFIDLALASRARWLFSRDRAVLKLARRARPLGLEVVSPLHWPGVGAS